MKISRNWLQRYFSKDLPSIGDIEAALVMHSFETEGITEYEHDAVVEIDVLPNRAPDALSHRGVARELASILDRDDYHEPSHAYELDNDAESLPIEIQSDQCYWYSAFSMRGIAVQSSPQWLIDALASVGQNSHNSVVDITNFIMLDIGTPLHIFDADKISGNTIYIRNAHDGEVFTPLGDDAKEYALDPSMLVIADDAKVLALAGIKGGNAAAVDEHTTHIIAEIAYFESQSTRATRMKTGIMTDSAKRFENNFYSQHVCDAQQLLAHYLRQSEIVGSDNLPIKTYGEAGTLPDTHTPASVTLSHKHMMDILHLDINPENVRDILHRLRCGVEITESDNGAVFTVTPPADRKDIAIPEDIIEEVGRLYGYHRIETVPLAGQDHAPVPPHIYLQFRISNILIDRGFHEVMTYAFAPEGDIAVHNPVAQDKPALRKNIRSGLEHALTKNTHHSDLFGADNITIFECGRIFTKKGGEEIAIACAVHPVNKKARKTYGDAREQLEALRLDLEKELGVSLPPLNADHLPVYEISLTALAREYTGNTSCDHNLIQPSALAEYTYQTPSAYPHTVRDIAFWTPDSNSADDMRERIINVAGPLLVRIDLFDEFHKDGKVSLAFRMVFQSHETTLTDEEILTIMNTIEAMLKKEGCELR